MEISRLEKFYPVFFFLTTQHMHFVFVVEYFFALKSRVTGLVFEILASWIRIFNPRCIRLTEAQNSFHHLDFDGSL